MSLHHPQTPQTPSQPSPGMSDPLPSMSTSMTSVSSTLPTPAHSVTGATSQPSDMSHDTAMTDISDDSSPHKRKRLSLDTGDQLQKKMHLDTPSLGIEDIHLDVGEKYLLCSRPIVRPRYSTSEDLFEVFDLTGLAAKMAREKPNGEKNALRKSFKSQVKELAIDGAYDTKKDERSDDDPDGFFAMLNLPEDVWYVHNVKGKEIQDGFSDQTLASLPKAITMLKGKVRKEHWDPYILGSLESPALLVDSSSNPANSTKPSELNTPAASTPSTLVRPKASNQTLVPGHDPARPRRNIKKRSYGDSSFEGYGDGFVDDDAGGYSTGEGDDRTGAKRRKKNPSVSQSFPPIRQQSYGPGMVGA
ncbi:related to Mediator of RNA polymerase II transcription subunit 19 [Cephalotrichum gorgonifer]|uniref:Mediator of RNA polymerase II transcription subunit 19 n=1 Tax=Cephalotrichum gorgonifer TaxID=2041049 RepID=A0AAE8MWB2_9PEZI|nr:related to Mediator of RNA polymerase II transcription subunit 19 [Cephalotrichum gorgonifer]